jgi:hypothetical protein
VLHAPLSSPHASAVSDGPLRLSIVLEWASTRLAGMPRAWALLDALGRQWRAIGDGASPETLPDAAVRLLARIDRRVEVLIASGDASAAALENEIRRRLPDPFDLEMLVVAGMEYYPLKSHAARRATGDLLLFLDSDLLPDEGWLAHLLGSFAQPAIDVVCGQTYVAPADLVARAFALGWTYHPRDESGKLFRPRKLYANNIAFRAEIFRRTGVAHPPPSSPRHMVVRALAHGRDHYMKRSEERHLAGLARSLGTAARRLGLSFYRAFRHRRAVGLERREVPAALAVCCVYYAFLALGGLLTHLRPETLGRRFRV